MVLVIFFEAIAGIITKAPINNVPTALMPTATMAATRSMKIKLVFSTLILVDLARSGDRVAKINFLEIASMIPITKRDKAMANTVSNNEIFEISPNSASRSSSSGVISKPMASETVKNRPTSDSVESWVLFSMNQIPITPRNKAPKAPKKGLI